jgi:two-component system chemotaxis response regulator CheB
MNAPADVGKRGPAELVVIGGSAGALDPLCEILAGLPADLSAPLAVVIHLPRRRPSHLAEALATKTARPVREARDKEPIAPGVVYVAPPDYHLLVDEGPSFALSIDEPVHFSRPSIDVLFESAADVLGPNVVAVLLSGANADGARGLGAIARAGGVAIVQPPAEAETPTMPEAGLEMAPSARALGSAATCAAIAELAAPGEAS